MEIVTKEKVKKTIPEGFKQTELGLYPENWETFKIIEIADDNTNWSFTGGPFGSDLKTEHYTEKGIRVIQLQNIGDGRFLNGSKVFTTKEKADELISANIYPGEIILSKMGDPVARACIVPDLHDRYLMCSDGIRLKVDSSRFDKTYIHTYINYKDFRSRAKNASSGSTRKRIGLQNLKQLKVVVPPLEEQQAIAEALSDVDGLIAELDALIKKKQQVKKGAMQQLLTGKKRLPGFDGEWEEKRLGEITNVVMGSSPSSNNYNQDGNGLPLIGGNADIKKRKSIKRIWTTQIPKKCNTGDVIMTVRAPVGTIAIASAESCLGRGVCAFQVDSIDKSFLFHQMMFNEPEWEALEQGSTFTSANSKQIEEFSISVPENKEEQKAIARILSDMDAEIQALQSKRTKYEKIKQGMMQVLLTGKTRLVKAKEERKELQESKQLSTTHSWAFNEAVIIATLADQFGDDIAFGRKRYTKLSYLLHRYTDNEVSGYRKKAAGPYNPKTKYGGPERIALEKEYMGKAQKGKYKGFVSGENIEEAQSYFDNWYGQEAINWIDENFRYQSNDDLELLTTVDKARIELGKEGQEVTLSTVKEVIASHPEWESKLERDIFSDENIQRAINESYELFG